MESISCAEIVNKLLAIRSTHDPADESRWWKNCVSFDYENMRSPKNDRCKCILDSDQVQSGW
jgi:hypothetical protein